MEVLKSYIDLTKDIRGDLTGLFTTIIKPQRKASKNTLSRWVKRMLKGTGIDLKIFSTHSTKRASTSMAKSEHEVKCKTRAKTNRRKQICRSNITICKC